MTQPACFSPPTISRSNRYTFPHKQKLLWRRHSGTEGTCEKTQRRYSTQTHSQEGYGGRGVQMIYLQFNTCTGGPRVSPACVAACVIAPRSNPSAALKYSQQNPHPNQLRDADSHYSTFFFS